MRKRHAINQWQVQSLLNQRTSAVLRNKETVTVFLGSSVSDGFATTLSGSRRHVAGPPRTSTSAGARPKSSRWTDLADSLAFRFALNPCSSCPCSPNSFSIFERQKKKKRNEIFNNIIQRLYR